jgi:hypothetical protein
VTSEQEYETSIRAADKGLREAQSAEDVRRVWKAHVAALGHRTLGRLLTGMNVERILDRREERAQRD